MGDACGKGKFKFYRDLHLPSQYCASLTAHSTRLLLLPGLNLISYDFTLFMNNHQLAAKGRFLEFRRYHNFANLSSKLSESTFYKQISKFQ